MGAIIDCLSTNKECKFLTQQMKVTFTKVSNNYSIDCLLLEEFVQTGISCRMPACTGRHSQVSKFFFFCIWTFLPGQVGRDTTQITAWVDEGSSRRCPTHCFRRHSLLRIFLHPDFIGNPPKILHFCTSLEVLYVSLFLKRNNIYCQIFCNKCIMCAKQCLGR